MDNIEIVGSDRAELVQNFLILKTWADTPSLTLDDTKTLTQPDLRAALKHLGCQVVEGALDPGASMVYRCRLKNSNFTSRIQSVMDYFTQHKCLGLQMALWPQALRNASHMVFGKTWITDLRRGAMRALRDNRASADPVLHLVYTDVPELDPGYFAAWQCLRDFFRFMDQEPQLRLWWLQFCRMPPRKPAYGPFACMARLCLDIGDGPSLRTWGSTPMRLLS